ncbi:MAG: hypothetical protein ACP5JC_03190, partial [Candidatus Micrarchaeia archaeon]
MGGHEEEEHIIASDIFEKKPGTRLEKKEEKKEEPKKEEKVEKKEEKVEKKEEKEAPVVKLTINIVLLSFAVFGLLASVGLYFIVDNAIDQGKTMAISRIETVKTSVSDAKGGMERMSSAIVSMGNGTATFGSNIGK